MLIAFLVLLFFSGFFSISETSMMALNRYRLRHLAKTGNRGARRTARLLERTDRLLGVILLGNNLANTAAAALVTVITFRVVGQSELSLTIATLVVTAAILIFSEITPKIIGATYPERIAFPASFVLAPLLKLAYPIVWFANIFVRGDDFGKPPSYGMNGYLYLAHTDLACPQSEGAPEAFMLSDVKLAGIITVTSGSVNQLVTVQDTAANRQSHWALIEINELAGYPGKHLIHRCGEITWTGSPSSTAEPCTTRTSLAGQALSVGKFFALDAETGKELWRKNLGGIIRANPVSYLVDGRQFVSIAAGNSIFTFGLDH